MPEYTLRADPDGLHLQQCAKDLPEAGAFEPGQIWRLTSIWFKSGGSKQRNQNLSDTISIVGRGRLVKKCVLIEQIAYPSLSGGPPKGSEQTSASGRWTLRTRCTRVMGGGEMRAVGPQSNVLTCHECRSTAANKQETKTKHDVRLN